MSNASINSYSRILNKVTNEHIKKISYCMDQYIHGNYDADQYMNAIDSECKNYRNEIINIHEKFCIRTLTAEAK